jgi:hypothetical protein
MSYHPNPTGEKRKKKTEKRKKKKEKRKGALFCNAYNGLNVSNEHTKVRYKKCKIGVDHRRGQFQIVQA